MSPCTRLHVRICSGPDAGQTITLRSIAKANDLTRSLQAADVRFTTSTSEAS